MSRHHCGWHCPTLCEGGAAIFVTGSARFSGLGTGGSAEGTFLGGHSVLDLTPSRDSCSAITASGFFSAPQPAGTPTEGVHAWASPRSNLGGNEVFGVLSHPPTRKKLCFSKKSVRHVRNKKSVRPPPLALHPRSRGGPGWVPASPRTSSIPILGSGGGVPIVPQAAQPRQPPHPGPKTGGKRQNMPTTHPQSAPTSRSASIT